MHFLRRKFLCERLRLGLRQSFRIVGASRSSLLSSDAILLTLNRARRGIAEPLVTIPSDLRTPEELCADLGLRPEELRAWSRRRADPAPHFALNTHTRRYSRALFTAWLAARSKPGGRAR